MKNPFTIEQWIAWIAATLTAALAMSAFAFTTFETRSDLGRYLTSIEKRLDRIEDRLNQALNK